MKGLPPPLVSIKIKVLDEVSEILFQGISYPLETAGTAGQGTAVFLEKQKVRRFWGTAVFFRPKAENFGGILGYGGFSLCFMHLL